MTDFRGRTEQLDPTVVKTRVEWNGAQVTTHDAFSLLAGEATFRSGLISALRSAAFAGYFWETPPVTRQTAARAFEFVLVDAPAFQHVSSEPSAFAEHFATDADRDGVVTFDNLGRDATLVVPCPRGDDSKYAHLAAFVRGAPDDQVDALFRAVGQAASRRLSERPLWLSTAGMGVYWLHVRLDSRPKYYRHDPYKKV